VPRLSTRTKWIIAILAILLLLSIGPIFLSFPNPAEYVSLEAEGVIQVTPGFSITNTMLAGWLSIIVVVGISIVATRKMKLVPTGLQNIVEAGIEMLYNFVESVAGERYGRSFFPIVATIFIFVIFNAWLALLPIFGPVFQLTTAHGSEPFMLFRNANTDLNLTLALAIISFCFVEFWGIRTFGVIRYGARFISVGQLFRGHILSGIIELFAGFIELITEFARIISFTFRLFGNMFAGELLLLVITFLIPLVLVDVFMGLELFFGFVQALIFAGLTLAFATIAGYPPRG